MPGERPDPFGRAIRDWYHDDLNEPLYARDGATTVDHPIEQFYFSGFDPDSESGAWVSNWLTGPLLDVGAGAGRHTLYFQDQFETVAIEVSPHLVETMEARGVEDARLIDMFRLREHFEPGRFESVLLNGTQLGLAASVADVREFLGDLAAVTTATGTVVLDSYDPRHPECEQLLGWRSEATDGIGARAYHFEYECDVGETLLFRFLSPDRFESVVADTDWELGALRGGVDADSELWQAALQKIE